ncbi:MAG TPA: sulfite exporter TauE/SafE family protein [Candidatus Saccharimonadales bacterium]|nr:sulfite exporter TauE/SafE family protein [Candidatus Saccharimonadales bacterium]
MDALAAFVIGLLASIVGAIATGGGLISIPGLIFLGASPVTAIATTRLNLMTAGISATLRYQKDGVVLWKYIPKFLVLGLVAGVLGPKLLLGLDQDTIQTLIGVMLIIMLPLLWIKKDLGTMNVKRSDERKLFGFIVMALVLFYTTVFGGGGGIFMTYTLVYFFGMTVTEAIATGLVIAMFATLVALITFASSYAVDWSLGIPLSLGGVIGGYIGANIALEKGVAWVKLILTLVIVVSSIKLLFFS